MQECLVVLVRCIEVLNQPLETGPIERQKERLESAQVGEALLSLATIKQLR